MRKQNLDIALVLIVLFAILLFSCRKNEKKTTYINKEMREFYGYDKGSYWIFFDSISNNIDSIYVVQNMAYISQSGNPDSKIEMATITLYDAHFDDSTMDTKWVISISGTSSSIVIHLNKTDELVHNLVLTMGMPISEQERAFNDTNKWQCSFHPTYNLSTSTSYLDVYKIYNGYEKSHDIFYINKEQGFIEIINNNRYLHKKMKLVRYNITRIK